jgi:GTP-binding protein
MEEQTVDIEPRRRVVAIVGRPNVGKSALFNRLAGRRVAIVHPQSGVTRDRLIREVSWDNQRFDLIDTGGIAEPDGAASTDAIERAIRIQAEMAIQDAAVVIFTVDLTAGCTPLDMEVANLLRKQGRTTFVAANKADTEEFDTAVSNFRELGFPAFPISALHGRGLEPLMRNVLKALPNTPNPTVQNPLKVAIVGRPNVGKSSFINALLGSDRVIVSPVPGTTRDSITIPFVVGTGPQARHYVLIDTAGLRKHARVDTSVEVFSRMRAEHSIREADVVVLILDASAGPLEQDKKVAATVQEFGKGCVVLVNKWDLLPPETTPGEYTEPLVRVMPFIAFCPVIYASAKTGFNVRRSIEAIDRVGASTQTKLPTGLLNRSLLNAYERVHPPMVQGRRLKIFYATQVGTAPIRIRLFVNDPKRITPAYQVYMIRVLRESFGLEGAPVVLHFTARREPPEHSKPAKPPSPSSVRWAAPRVSRPRPPRENAPVQGRHSGRNQRSGPKQNRRR